MSYKNLTDFPAHHLAEEGMIWMSLTLGMHSPECMLTKEELEAANEKVKEVAKDKKGVEEEDEENFNVNGGFDSDEGDNDEEMEGEEAEGEEAEGEEAEGEEAEGEEEDGKEDGKEEEEGGEKKDDKDMETYKAALSAKYEPKHLKKMCKAVSDPVTRTPASYIYFLCGISCLQL